MKRIPLALLLLFTITTVAQSNSINYKALIKDANNAVVANTQVTVQFQILQGVAQTNVYQETHTPTTDANGIIIINIGEGTVNSGVYANIDWSSDDHFLNTQINSGSGLTDMGTTGFNAVPYALSAKTAETATNVTGLETIDEGNGNGLVKVGRVAANYGNVGLYAVDLSFATFANTTRGATGDYSTAMGSNTTASGILSTAMGASTMASGKDSTAFGDTTTASGESSTAFGDNSTASGDYTTAFGRDSQALGEYSTAMGRLAIASGRFSTAMGWDSTAESYAQTTLGTFNVRRTPNNANAFNTLDPILVVGNGININAKSDALVILKNGTITAPSFGISEITDAKALVTKEYADANYIDATFSGDYNDLTNTPDTPFTFNTTSNTGIESASNTASGVGATAFGSSNTASGGYSTATGRLSTASGGYSTAIGHSTNASGIYSFASGRETEASGGYSTAMGYQTEASEEYSTSMGSGTTASGTSSTAMGLSTTASGSSSTATGSSTTASGFISTAMGRLSTASGGHSTAIGHSTNASGSYSFASGRTTTAESYGQASLGSYNVPTTPISTTTFNALDRLLVVGNGQLGSTSDALVILKNGTITAPSFGISEITDAKALVTKEYADANYIDAVFSGNYNDLSNVPVLFNGDYNNLTNQPALFSESYNDLTDLPVLFTTADETDPKVTSTTTNTVPKWDGTSLVDGSINDVDGDIAIGTATPDPSAQLEVSSTTKGFLPPRMTDSQKNFMDNPAAGLIVYCNDCGTDGQMQMFNGTIWTDMIGGSTVGGPAAIGDKRAGGVVFWVDPTDNTHGLVCALSDYTGTEVWGCYPTDLPNVPNVPWNGASTVGLGAEIGDGQSNTANMLIDCPTSPTALAARSLGLEWFLPSILELNEMYSNRATLEAVAGFNAFVSIGGINNTKYWSSTEFNANWSHNFSFLDGGFNYNNKSTSILRVRAARAF